MSGKNQPTTIHQVASLAGVSPATVSRVLNGTAPVRPATRERVLQAVAELGFEPNALARSLARHESCTVGILISDIRNPFYAELVCGIQEVAEANGYLTYLCHAHQEVDKELAYLSSLRAHRVDGLIIGHSRLTDEDIGAYWEKIDVPVVLIHRPPPVSKTWTHISADDFSGGYMATRHLLELGHRRVAHLAGPGASFVARRRHEGYCQALVERGIVYNPELVIAADLPTFEAGRGNMLTLLGRLSEPPTAVFAFSDIMAIGAIEAIRQHGLVVPGDISVVGYDDIPAAQWTVPALTTVRHPTFAMGRLAMELLLRLLHGETDVPGVTLEQSLVVRGSTTLTG